MSWAEEVESEDCGEDSSISLTEVADTVEKLLSSRASGVDEIHLEMLKALDIVGLTWLTHLNEVVGSTSGVADWGGGSHL